MVDLKPKTAICICLANSMTFQDQGHFPGLFRSSKFSNKNSRTFMEAWEVCGQNFDWAGCNAFGNNQAVSWSVTEPVTRSHESDVITTRPPSYCNQTWFHYPFPNKVMAKPQSPIVVHSEDIEMLLTISKMCIFLSI